MADSMKPAGGESLAPVGYWSLLRDNDRYRRLWLAEVISFLGDWFNTIALYSAVAELSGGTQAFAITFVAKLLPVFVVMPIAGPLIDRFDRRRLMIVTDVARALCALGLIGAYRLQSLTLLWLLLVVMVGFAGVFTPARSAVLPQLTTLGELPAANALSGATWSVMLALGAAAGGAVTAAVGIEASLVCDAATFVASALLLVGLPPLAPRRAQGPGEGHGFFAGLRYLARRRYLTAVVLLKPGLALAGGVLAMLPVFATREFSAGNGVVVDEAAAIGVLFTARGLGALIGSLVMRRIFGDRPATLRRLCVVGFVVVASAYGGLSYAGSLWQAAAAYFGATIGGGMVWVFSTTLGQLASDDAYRGRVFALEFALLTLVMSATGWGAGVLVDHAGWSVRAVARATAGLMLLPAVAWSAVLLARRRGPGHFGKRGAGNLRGSPPLPPGGGGCEGGGPGKGS
jgi:MFS family permease